jgi:hypothetical protein
MLHSRVYYYSQPSGYSNYFRGIGLIVGTLVASNALTMCPKYINKYSEIYMIGFSSTIIYSIYLFKNNKYRNTFWNDFKNSFFITMCGSLIYTHSFL